MLTGKNYLSQGILFLLEDPAYFYGQKHLLESKKKISFPYLLGFHQHLEKHGKTPCREKNLLLPTARSITGGVLKIPPMLFAHFFHYYLRQE